MNITVPIKNTGRSELISTVESLHMGLFFYYIQVLFQPVVLCTIKNLFYGTQYDLYDQLKKDSYVIKKDSYVRIWRLRLMIFETSQPAHIWEVNVQHKANKIQWEKDGRFKKYKSDYR
jgi:hypothetical protein